jgi:hypothetical protein
MSLTWLLNDTMAVALLGAAAALLGLAGVVQGPRRPARAGLRAWSALLLVLGPGVVVWHAHALDRQTAPTEGDLQAPPATGLELVTVESAPVGQAASLPSGLAGWQPAPRPRPEERTR